MRHSGLQEVGWTGTRSVYLQVSERPQTEENIRSTSRLRSLLPPGGGGRKHAAAEEHLSSSSPASPPSALGCYLQMERCHFLFWVHFLDPSVSSTAKELK